MNNDLIKKYSEYLNIIGLIKLNKLYDNEIIQDKIINLFYYRKYYEKLKENKLIILQEMYPYDGWK